MNLKKVMAAIVVVAGIVTISVALSATAPKADTQTTQPENITETVEVYYHALSTGDKEQALAVTTGELHKDVEYDFDEMSRYINQTNTTIEDVEPVRWEHRTRVKFQADLSPNGSQSTTYYATTIKNVSVRGTPKIAQDPYTQP